MQLTAPQDLCHGLTPQQRSACWAPCGDQGLLLAWALSMADVEQLQPHKEAPLQWAVGSEPGVGLLLPQPADGELLAGLGTSGASHGETLWF